MYNFKNITLNASIALFITFSSNQSVSAENYDNKKEVSPNAEQMMFDGLVLRPLSLAATVVGTGIFVVTLPFSLLGGNVEQAGNKLVAEPAAATFTNCLGCIKKDKKRY